MTASPARMHPRRSFRIAAALAVGLTAALAACGSTPAGPLLPPPRVEAEAGGLETGRIEIESALAWVPSKDTIVSRAMECRDGRVTAIIRRQDGREERAPVEPEVWRGLWRQLLAAGAFASGAEGLDVKERDTTSAQPYHTVQLALGPRTTRFSSQHRAEVLGLFVTEDGVQRVDLVNAIAASIAGVLPDSGV